MLSEVLLPFLHWDLGAWEGLPPASRAEFEATLGQGRDAVEDVLGTRPATRMDFSGEVPAGGLRVWFRRDKAVMVEALRPPPIDAVQALGEPSVILPQEIQREGAYVHEHLFCERGVVVSVTEPFSSSVEPELIRCRGLKVLASPREFGADFYLAFEDRRDY